MLGGRHSGPRIASAASRRPRRAGAARTAPASRTASASRSPCVPRGRPQSPRLPTVGAWIRSLDSLARRGRRPRRKRLCPNVQRPRVALDSRQRRHWRPQDARQTMVHRTHARQGTVRAPSRERHRATRDWKSDRAAIGGASLVPLALVTTGVKPWTGISLSDPTMD